MLAIWNRRELVTVLTMQEQSDILSALRDAGLDYTVKAIDRSSPSALNPGTRADFGTMARANARAGLFGEKGRFRFPTQTADAGVAREPRFS